MTDQKVRTCDVYRTDPNLPSRFNNPDCFSGYSQKKIHPLYRTSNQTYGSKKPTVHEMQTQFKGTSHQFSKALLHSGMYCDNGFNTFLETGMVTTSASTQKRREDIHYFRHCLNQCSDGNKG